MSTDPRKSAILEASELLNRVVAEACGGAWDHAKRDAWMRDWTAFQARSAERLFSEPAKGSLERVEKERDVARLTVAQWDRMHAVCKETMGGRPDEFLPMVCSRVTGERDVAVAKLAAIAEVVHRGGLEHANSCHGPDGCVCEIGEIRAILSEVVL